MKTKSVRKIAVESETPKTKAPKKAELTRQKIVESALQLFAERGFEQTTMRLIAEGAGVSVGNAYYYFKSKEDLMQAYYQGIFESFSEHVTPVLVEKTDFVDRLSGAINIWIDVAQPYHAFAGSFFRTAADPASPLSPFSEESNQTRQAMVDAFEEVVTGSRKLKVSDDVRPRLPELLWLFHMGVVLFWVYDNSENQARTRMLVDRAAPVIGQLLGLSRLPVLRGSAKELMQLIDALAPPAATKNDGGS
jgi:AcrR family transcriptional regulator